MIRQFKITGMLLLSALALSLGSIGCKTGQLETGGAYAPGVEVVADGRTNVVATAAPDRALFVIDSAFELAYSAVDTAFSLEKTNRQLLWSISPDIKHTLDRIRPQAADAVRTYTRAREQYLQNPTPANLSLLETTLRQLQNLASAAQMALPKQN